MTWPALLLALWPLWLVLAALGVWWLAARYGYAPSDTEEPCGCSFGCCCGFCTCCPPVPDFDSPEAQKYHNDNGWGR